VAQAIGKIWGVYTPADVVGPDSMYKLAFLKDMSKANKTGRNEIIGATRHRDPALCTINAAITMLILKFGRRPDGKLGYVSGLPDFFERKCNWPVEPLFTEIDGVKQLRYTGSQSCPGHYQLFAAMKRASGLEGLMGDCATKLRSFGAMWASDHQAPHPEIERFGRKCCSVGRALAWDGSSV
jgi:hypothetical protein